MTHTISAAKLWKSPEIGHPCPVKIRNSLRDVPSPLVGNVIRSTSSASGELFITCMITSTLENKEQGSNFINLLRKFI